MAEAIVVTVIEKIGPAIAERVLPACSLLLHKALPPEEMHNNMELIRTELEHMRRYLRSVDTAKEHGSDFSIGWAKDLKEVAYDLEDIIDEYTYLMGEQHRSGFTGYLERSLGYYKNMNAWSGISLQLTQINSRLSNLSKMKERYGGDSDKGGESSTSNVGQTHRHLAELSHFIEDDDIVGFDDYRNKLVGWLTESETMRTVISVFGMGGLGKTTLVTAVYKSQAVKLHFDCKAWVFVSQAHATTEDLLRLIVKEMLEQNNEDISRYNVNEMPLRRLVETLQSYLQGKRYLIVLDDVWQSYAWFELSSALLDNKLGSRVVLTTRIHAVASLAIERRIIEIQPLHESDSWILFCKKAFWKEKDPSCPQELRHWAQTIEERCHGVPLAIVATSSLLSFREKTELEWRKISEFLDWQDSSLPMSDRVKNILNLSFKDLPYYLRNCFLYCTIFPQGYQMKRKRLIRLWIAEGFVEQVKNRTMEEVAEGYLNELIHRCMLQVVRWNHFGRVKICRMHDLMRDLAEAVSEKENFCVPYGDNGEAKLTAKARRLSVGKLSDDIEWSSGMSHIRSFLLFGIANFSQSSFKSVSAHFRLLRVLDLEGIPIDEVPDQVVELFNLYYLGLRKTRVKQLPKSLGRLQNLQTLDLYDSCIQSLPRSITKLKKLRHLLLESILYPTFAELGCDPGIRAPRGLWKLKTLQTLQSVEADERTVSSIGDLVQLRTLKIAKLRSIHCKQLCASISRMSHLVNLDIAASEQGGMLQLENLKIPQHQVKKLELRGALENGVLPSWLGSLDNLRHLGLSWSMLRENPIPSLQSLPNLAVLCLRTAYNERELRFSAGGFPKLKLLILGGSNILELMYIEKGAMPNLTELRLFRCGGMKSVPRGIEHLSNIQVLHLIEMPQVLIENLRGGTGSMEEQLKIQHIPDPL